MELTIDLINIQGILINLQKKIGKLNKIRHKGGNEESISNVKHSIEKYLQSKNYIENEGVNKNYDSELRNLVLFLILNTELNYELDLEEYAHLTNIMPQLSKCILANIIIDLDLSHYYCEAFEKLSLNIIEELLTEIVVCLKNCSSNVQLENTHQFLQAIIKKLSDCGKVCEESEKLANISTVLLVNLSQLQLDYSKNWKRNDIYKHLGLSLYKLFNLLLQCDPNNLTLLNFIEKLMNASSLLAKTITVDIFCHWAEVKLDENSLQNLIAEKAYLIIEKYNKYKPAKELISVLASIAKKPKTLNQLIQLADVPTVITMINKADNNQKHWFRALLNTNVVQNKQAINCVNRWSNLCKLSDVSRLLNLSIHSNDLEVKNLVIKCAANLEMSELILVSTRHFIQNGVDNNLNEQPQQQLIILFNKLKDNSNIKEVFSKELHLLMLQNPKIVLSHVFSECLKNSFHTQNLRNIFPCFKEIAQVKSVGINALIQEINNNKPSELNYKFYIELLNMLIEIEFYSIEFVTMKIILPILQKFGSTEEDYNSLKYVLEILLAFQKLVILNEETEVFFVFLFDLMAQMRCKFLEFELIKQEIVSKCVDYINIFVNSHYCCYETECFQTGLNPFVNFYQKKLLDRDGDENLLKELCPNFNSGNKSEVVCCLIKVLPMCVASEWSTISLDLLYNTENNKTVELLTDFLILLCQLVSKEGDAKEINCMMNGLKFCIQNFGIVMKDIIQPKLNNNEEDVNLTKNICRLLKEIPTKQMKCELGLPLVNILSDNSLKLLGNDKMFACLVASINEPMICQTLAQKILNKK